MNPLVKAPLTIVAVAAILYALLPPAPQQEDVEHPFTVDLAVQTRQPETQITPASESQDQTATVQQETPETSGEIPTTSSAAQSDDTGVTTDSDTAESTAETADTGESLEPPQTEVAASPEQSVADEPAGADAVGETEAQMSTGEETLASPSAGDTTEDANGEAPAVTATEESEAATPEDEGWVEHEIQSGDTLAAIFKDFGLSSTLLAQLVDSGPAAKTLAEIHPGQKLALRLDPNGDFEELAHERSSVATLRILRTEDGFESHVDEKPIEVRTHTASGTINSSLFEDGQSAGLSDKLIMALADLFNWDIDFARELHEGDHFSVIYEANYVDGEKYRDSDILAAEFVNNGKSFRAIRFQDPEGLVEYYAPDGSAKKKAFIKTPVKFSRISSRFTNSRWHPVLKRWRSHKGVDYAAPTGTPVKAAGKGKVSFIGRQQGYGKVIYLQHGDRYATVYGHLSGFAKGLKKGDAVKQGDIIGYVGQTGLATGPHLHYEFRVNGKHVDPLSHDLPTAMPLPAKYMAAFKKHAEPLVEQLNLLAAPQVAETR